MIINDVIYGKEEIKEPVLKHLANSRQIQRLKKIQQYGVPPSLYRVPGFSRYEHSVGVLILLRRLGASLDEQIDGLTHDASHAAFSHVFDWVVGSQKAEDSQDRNHLEFMLRSDIPAILKFFGFDINKVIKNDSHMLLETKSPDLCADRVDYGLREFYYWVDRGSVKYCIENLINYQGKMVFAKKDSAKIFAENFLKCQAEHWGAPEPMIRYHLFSEMLKKALGAGIIKKEDFYKDDYYIMKKLRQSSDREVKKILEVLSREIKFENAAKNPQLKLKKKFRYVDPEFMDSGELKRLSLTDKEFRLRLEEQRSKNKEGISVNILS